MQLFTFPILIYYYNNTITCKGNNKNLIKIVAIFCGCDMSRGRAKVICPNPNQNQPLFLHTCLPENGY